MLAAAPPGAVERCTGPQPEPCAKHEAVPHYHITQVLPESSDQTAKGGSISSLGGKRLCAPQRADRLPLEGKLRASAQSPRKSCRPHRFRFRIYPCLAELEPNSSKKALILGVTGQDAPISPNRCSKKATNLRRRASDQHPQPLPTPPPRWRPRDLQPPTLPSLRRPRRSHHLSPGADQSGAAGNLPPGRPEPCRLELRNSRVHLRTHRHGHPPPLGNDPRTPGPYKRSAPCARFRCLLTISAEPRINTDLKLRQQHYPQPGAPELKSGRGGWRSSAGAGLGAISHRRKRFDDSTHTFKT